MCSASSLFFCPQECQSSYIAQVGNATYYWEKFHARYADVYGTIWTNHAVNYDSFNHPSILVHIFEGGAFQVVESPYGGADHQHNNVVFPGFFYLAESA